MCGHFKNSFSTRPLLLLFLHCELDDSAVSDGPQSLAALDVGHQSQGVVGGAGYAELRTQDFALLTRQDPPLVLP